MDWTAVRYEQISIGTPVHTFSCSVGVGRDDLERFLREEALDVSRQQIARTVVVMIGDRVVAYVTYGIDSIKHEFPDAVALGMDSHVGHILPALRVYQLAVAEGFQKSGLGTALMDHVFQTVTKLGLLVPCPQVVVTSYSDAVGFYERFGFERASGAAQRWVSPQVLLIAALAGDD